METLQFDILHADGRREQTSALAARIVIGSGAHCDVRLAADQAAFEHVAIEQRDPTTGPMLRALAPTPMPMFDGATLTTQLVALPATALLGIGGTQIQITRQVQVAAPTKSAIGPAMLAKLLVIAGLFGAIAFLSLKSKDAQAGAPPAMPELFAKAASVCPRTDPTEARATADDERARADGARERSPFDPRESRAAVKSYETAAACYRQLGLAEPSEDAAMSAKRMRDETVLDFRARRVRLERLLMVHDYELAAQDVAVLTALTEGQSGPFARWLATVAQDLKNQKVEKKK